MYWCILKFSSQKEQNNCTLKIEMYHIYIYIYSIIPTLYEYVMVEIKKILINRHIVKIIHSNPILSILKKKAEIFIGYFSSQFESTINKQSLIIKRE
jgi:hypothetical protein